MREKIIKLYNYAELPTDAAKEATLRPSTSTGSRTNMSKSFS